MKRLIAAVLVAMFATVSFQVVAQDKKPTADECKKNPTMKGCEPSVIAVRVGEGGAGPRLFLLRIAVQSISYPVSI